MKLLLERWNKYLNEDLNTATRLSVFDFDETLAFSEGKIDILDQKETSLTRYRSKITTSGKMMRESSQANLSLTTANLMSSQIQLR